MWHHLGSVWFGFVKFCVIIITGVATVRSGRVRAFPGLLPDSGTDLLGSHLWPPVRALRLSSDMLAMEGVTLTFQKQAIAPVVTAHRLGEALGVLSSGILSRPDTSLGLGEATTGSSATKT